MRIFMRTKRLNLALQGGGVHGAFTWGVLHRLLQEQDLEIGWISGTSAGAVNAVALAHGLAHADAAMASATLQSVWNAVERAGVPDLMQLNPFLSDLTRSSAFSSMTKFFSPYEFNPAGFHPLREILMQHIDFDAIREAEHIGLLIAATDIATGRARLFERAELSLEAVLASTCLPNLHHAVEIGGRAYWDGGFSANPDLITLASRSPVHDTLLVQLTPVHQAQVPRGSKSIEDRVNMITFNQPLLRDIKTIALIQQGRRDLFPRRRGQLARLRTHHFHLVSAGKYTADLAEQSKLIPEKKLIAYLHQAGSQEMSAWLDRNSHMIGRGSSVDLAEEFTGSPFADSP